MTQSSQFFGFWTSPNLTYSIDPAITGYSGAVGRALAAWANVSPFELTYVGGSGGDIHYQAKADPSAPYAGRAGVAVESSGAIRDVIVELGDGSDYLSLHESGHALAQINDFQALPQLHTIYGATGGGPNWIEATGALPTAPAGADIAAIQARYGASSADNLIHAGEGGYTVSGGWGNDTIHGEGGNDIIYGNQGLDALYGGEGDDTIYGGQNAGELSGSPLALRDGVETVQGGNGSDVIYGNHGNDELYGEAGNDTLYGGQNDDMLVGGDGIDRLIGNLGNDSYWGNADADIFEVTGGGSDVVWDFNAAEGDRIDVANPGAVSLESNGADAIFWHETGSITLVGISQSQASLDWLI